MQESAQTNVKDKSTWMRLIYIVIFAIAFNIAELLIAIITVVQFFSVLFTKAPNTRLKQFGGDLGVYIRDVVRFLTYQTDQMPYPVSDWQHEVEPIITPAPKPKPAPKPAPKAATKAAAKPAAKRKPAAKKTPPGKKPDNGPTTSS